MSTHCSKYPSCNCPPGIGINCYSASDITDKFGDLFPPPKSNEQLVDELLDAVTAPRIYDDPSMVSVKEIAKGAPQKKHRNYPTNYTKPKKRRK